MKSISVIEPGKITYPIGVYEKYNLYLIQEYEKLLDLIPKLDYSLQRKEAIILYTRKLVEELENLLKDNTEVSIEKIFHVMDWEENLRHFYTLLEIRFVELRVGSIQNLDIFLRKEKLNKINKIDD